MKMKTISIAVAMLIAASGAAVAQATVVVAPEQQTVVREYVTKHRVSPVTLPGSVTLAVGATLPEDVELHSFEGVEGVGEYRYVVVGNQTVLVQPGTRKVVQIID